MRKKFSASSKTKLGNRSQLVNGNIWPQKNKCANRERGKPSWNLELGLFVEVMWEVANKIDSWRDKQPGIETQEGVPDKGI